MDDHFIVSIANFFAPGDAKTRLVKASSSEEAKALTRMWNPDILQKFDSRQAAIHFLEEQFGTEWSEVELKSDS